METQKECLWETIRLTSFEGTSNLEPLNKYTMWPHLVVQRDGEEEKCLLFYCNINLRRTLSTVHHNTLLARPGADHPPARCWKAVEKRSLNCFPRSVKSDLLKLWTGGKVTPLEAVQQVPGTQQTWPWLMIFGTKYPSPELRIGPRHSVNRLMLWCL